MFLTDLTALCLHKFFCLSVHLFQLLLFLPISTAKGNQLSLLLINILFALNHYADIHSSKTAALLITAGFLLLLNSINNKRYNLPCWVGAAEVAFGSFFDYKYFFIGLPFAVAFL